MKEKLFMIDIETTGIDPVKEDLLQIGVLELNYDGQCWKPGRSIEIQQHTGRFPQSEFAKTHMAALYARCRDTFWSSPEKLRQDLTGFFESCGAKGPYVYLAGWNASNFDIPFLCHHRVLIPSRYEQDNDGKDVFVGDFHYRIYELGGAVSLAMDVLNREDRNGLCEEAASRCPEIDLPPGKEHDALFDCYKQTKIMNGLIRMLRQEAK